MIGVLGATRFGNAGFVLGWVLGAALFYGASTRLSERVANAAAAMYLSSGSSTPARREYSLGDALAAQGRFQEALAEYDRCAAAFPDDPEPSVRMARLLRDHLRQPGQAAHLFRRALEIPALPPASEWALARELTELCTHRLGDPAPALPVLARLAHARNGTAAADWARAELQRLKQELRERNG
jgi:tetratricopeptide (TPR) repeat protein